MPRTPTRTRLRLRATDLRRSIDPRALPGPRAWSRHRTHIIGQERAIQALELGLRLEAPGYNVFVSGPGGTGRMTTTRHILGKFKEPRRPLRDYVYVYNFQEPDRARLLVLQPGLGLRLKRVTEQLVEGIKSKLARVLRMETMQAERDQVAAAYQQQEEELSSAFQRRVCQAGFAPVDVEDGPVVERDILPIIDEKPQTLAAHD
jgi:hypothetical protein